MWRRFAGKSDLSAALPLLPGEGPGVRSFIRSSSAAGRPRCLAPKQFEKILQTVHASFDLRPSDPSGTLETSLEANPGTVTLDSLRDLRRIGFNRISFGVQSAHPDELRQLERIHDFFDVIQSVKWARQAGFDNLNLDLIYGLPEQTLSRWQDSLRRAVDLGPEHLSLYALTIEHGTPFGRWAARGLLPMPDPDLAADMYEWAGEYLEDRDMNSMKFPTGQNRDVSAATTSSTGATSHISASGPGRTAAPMDCAYPMFAD